MQNSKSGRSLAVRVGAFTAALSLMLAGGVALASSASAAPKPDNPGQGQGQGADSQTKPKPNANENNPQKNDTLPNPNADKPGNVPEVNGPSGSKNPEFAPGEKVWVCHADANNGNAANAAAVKDGGGNNLGQNGGGNTHAGFSIIYISVQAWNANHARLHENDSAWETEAQAQAACGTPATTTTDWYRCIAPGPVEQVNAVTSKPAGDGWTEGTAPAGLTCPNPTDWYRCIAPGPVEQVTDATSKPEGDGWLAGIAPAGLTCLNGTAKAAMQAQLCEVDGNGGYKAGPATWTGPTAEGADDAAAIQAATDALVGQLKTYVGSNPDAIVKPFGGFSANWPAGAETFDKGCVLPIGVSAAEALAAANPLAGTVAPAAGKPAPAKTPTSATLPGSVPAGDGSSIPAVPFWALAMVVAGAIGAAAAGKSLVSNK